jgi:hypothetical protein
VTRIINAQFNTFASPCKQGKVVNRCKALVTITSRNYQVCYSSTCLIFPCLQLPTKRCPSRLIATHYILDVSTSSYCPATWDLREHWPHRIVYTIFRDAFALEKLMTMCPSWGSAREPQSRPSACIHSDLCLQSSGIAFGITPVVRSTLLRPSHSIPSPNTTIILLLLSASHHIINFV